MTVVPREDVSEPIRDLATTAGSYSMVRTTVGDYLGNLRLYDAANGEVNWDNSIVTAPFQRAVIDISKNPIKRRMLRDLLRGGTLPPTVLFHRGPDQDELVDGLQRTHVLVEAVRVLARHSQGEKAPDFAEEEIAGMRQLGQKPLTLDDLLSRPVVFQRWKDLRPEELVRLFIILNAGQQKVSPRHLLEVMGADIKEMFKSWDLPLLTERQEKEQPRRRGRKPVKESLQPTAGVTHFRYEYLLDGLHAYVGRDPHVKTNKLLQASGDSARLPIEERITEIGSEVCKADFVWACKDLNEAIKEKYTGTPKWRYAIQTSDNFFIPLMAALGDARTTPWAKPAIEDRKAKLIDIIKTSGSEDPLVLAIESSQSLTHVLNSIRSNIGRKQRSVIFIAFKRYFRNGTDDQSYPIDWREALMD